MNEEEDDEPRVAIVPRDKIVRVNDLLLPLQLPNEIERVIVNFNYTSLMRKYLKSKGLMRSAFLDGFKPTDETILEDFNKLLRELLEVLIEKKIPFYFSHVEYHYARETLKICQDALLGTTYQGFTELLCDGVYFTEASDELCESRCQAMVSFIRRNAHTIRKTSIPIVFTDPTIKHLSILGRITEELANCCLSELVITETENTNGVREIFVYPIVQPISVYPIVVPATGPKLNTRLEKLNIRCWDTELLPFYRKIVFNNRRYLQTILVEDDFSSAAPDKVTEQNRQYKRVWEDSGDSNRNARMLTGLFAFAHDIISITENINSFRLVKEYMWNGGRRFYCLHLETMERVETFKFYLSYEPTFVPFLQSLLATRPSQTNDISLELYGIAEINDGRILPLLNFFVADDSIVKLKIKVIRFRMAEEVFTSFVSLVERLLLKGCNRVVIAAEYTPEATFYNFNVGNQDQPYFDIPNNQEMIQMFKRYLMEHMRNSEYIFAINETKQNPGEQRRGMMRRLKQNVKDAGIEEIVASLGRPVNSRMSMRDVFVHIDHEGEKFVLNATDTYAYSKNKEYMKNNNVLITILACWQSPELIAPIRVLPKELIRKLALFLDRVYFGADGTGLYAQKTVAAQLDPTQSIQPYWWKPIRLTYYSEPRPWYSLNATYPKDPNLRDEEPFSIQDEE
jgi:hypothetical protein